jgi:uncharacterized membrane protein
LSARCAAWAAACACLIALILLCMAWELFLAPVRPGGSWLVLKALPLLVPLFGVVRVVSDRGPSVPLAALEIALVLGYFAAAVVFVRATPAA